MRISNTTDIPREAIAEVIRFVRPAGIGRFTVRIHNTSGTRPTGHGGGRLVTIGMPTADKRCRYRTWGNGAYLRYWVGGRTEALVAIMAHELRHVWQTRHPKGWRVYGSRGQYSERDADAFALRKLRAWRRR